jgi:hypothetical protein
VIIRTRSTMSSRSRAYFGEPLTQGPTAMMKVAAAMAVADLVGDQLSTEYIAPSPLDPRVAPAMTAAVIAAV